MARISSVMCSPLRPTLPSHHSPIAASSDGVVGSEYGGEYGGGELPLPPPLPPSLCTRFLYFSGFLTMGLMRCRADVKA